jgi:transketolase
VERLINTIRFLAVDAVEKANSGHPGLPVVCAPLGHVLFDEFLPLQPQELQLVQPLPLRALCWPRLHDPVLHYALLHLAGYQGVTVSSKFPVT